MSSKTVPLSLGSPSSGAVAALPPVVGGGGRTLHMSSDATAALVDKMAKQLDAFDKKLRGLQSDSAAMRGLLSEIKATMP